MLKVKEFQDNLKTRLTVDELSYDLVLFLVAGHEMTAVTLSMGNLFIRTES